jgi:L-rhamnonate dehydratase
VRITDIEALVLEAPGDYGTTAGAAEAHGPKRTCVIVVTTDEGIQGHAQIETQPHVVEAIVGAHGEASGFFSGLRSLALGEDPRDVEALWDRLFLGSFYFGRRGATLQAISGIDIACWDILGKATGLPVATLLGGKRRDTAVAYASTLFRTTRDGMREASEHYLEQGFRAVKFGWGPFGDDLRQDVQMVEAAREALGDDRTLLVDAGWRRRRTLKDAVQLVHALQPLEPFWIEEPCFPEDIGTYERLAALATGVRIAAGEAETTAWDFRRLADAGVDVLQPDLSRCGGLTVARRVAYLAEERNLLVCPHAWGSDLLTAATLQFVAFLPRDTLLEFNTSADPLSRDLVATPLRLEDGMVRVPEGPGLGVEPDMEAIRALAIG